MSEHRTRVTMLGQRDFLIGFHIDSDDAERRHAKRESELYLEARRIQLGVMQFPGDTERRSAYGRALREWANYVGHQGAKLFADRLIMAGCNE